MANRLRLTSLSSTSLRIVDRFATDFEALPEAMEGGSAARVLVATGRLVRAVVVCGLLAADDSIDLVGVELNL